MRTHLLLLVVLLSALPLMANAQAINTIKPGHRQDGPMAELRDMGSFVVKATPDPLTFVLGDGKSIRLSGVDLPLYPGEKENPFAALALQRIQSLYLGQKVNLYQTRDAKKGRTNSMGQQLGHIVKREGDKEHWAQKILLQEGLARALPTISNPETAAALFEAEEEARKVRKGLWSTAPWSVKSPTEVSGYIGTIQVVNGKVETVSTRNNVTYLNFGKDWKTDFTVEIDAATRRALLKDKINPLALAGHNIEVRGFVESRNGPNIRLDTPVLLRLLDGPKTAKEELVIDLNPLEQGSEVIRVEPVFDDQKKELPPAEDVPAPKTRVAPPLNQ